MQIPETVIDMAIEPRTQAEKNKLHEALERLSREDPTFRQHVDQQTGQLLISGMGELHLDIIRDRLLREFSVDARIGEPRVSYRESLIEAVTVEEAFQKEMEGHGQDARVVIKFEPDPCGAALKFENRVDKELLAVHFVKAVERSLTQGASGALYGFPLINVKATLLDATSHPTDSSELAFEAAAAGAQRHALEQGGCRLYEPYMKLEIITPEDDMGDVITSSTVATAPSRRCIRARRCASSGRRPRWRSSSASPPSCGPSPRAAAPTAWSRWGTARPPPTRLSSPEPGSRGGWRGRPRPRAQARTPALPVRGARPEQPEKE